MPVTVEELDDGRGVRFHAFGELTDAEFLTTVEAHLRAEDVGKYRYNLSDFTAVETVKLSSRAIFRSAELGRDSAVRRDLVMAVVADRDFLFGLARMWQAFARSTGWETGVFRSRTEAATWLRDEVDKRGGRAPHAGALRTRDRLGTLSPPASGVRAFAAASAGARPTGGGFRSGTDGEGPTVPDRG